MDRISNIVAAVGEFPQDDAVLARAAQIARGHQAKLTIVHVIDDFGEFYPTTDLDMALIQRQVRRFSRESVETAVARQAIDVAASDIRIETGSPSLRLLEVIDEMDADLVVMRAHQGDSIVAKIVGSTTDRVIRASPVPVLVVKRPVTEDYQNIVVSIDTADDSIAVIPFVDRMFPLARVSLLHVVQIPQQLQAAMLRSGSGQSIATHRDALIRKAQVSLRATAKKLVHRPRKSATRVVAGDAANYLVQATWNSSIGLIVLGPSSTGAIRRALLGSVARRVLRNAACDVLICRSTKENTGPCQVES